MLVGIVISYQLEWPIFYVIWNVLLCILNLAFQAACLSIGLPQNNARLKGLLLEGWFCLAFLIMVCLPFVVDYFLMNEHVLFRLAIPATLTSFTYIVGHTDNNHRK